MRQKLRSITQFIKLPAICELCHQFHSGFYALCHFCIQIMPQLQKPCQRCANPMSSPDDSLCGECIKNPPYFDRALIYHAFDEPLRSLLHQFKYRRGLYLAPLLSHLINQGIACEAHLPQCLIPMPIHRKRLQSRGFNQALILTQQLSKHWGIPYLLQSCHKIINTPPQANLNAHKRQSNLMKAFQVSPIPYQHVGLVDDLLTTGSTANALAYALKKVGVQRVDIWCCARTVRRKDRLG